MGGGTRTLGIVRSAAVAAALSTSLSMPVSGSRIAPVEGHIRVYGSGATTAYESNDSRIRQLYSEARRCYSEGHWDISRLREIQREYDSYVGNRRSLFMTNGIHDAVLKLMPVIDRVARREHIDPSIIAGVIEKESEGYMFTIGKIGELGLMQINPHAYPEIFKKERVYRDIFNPETNIAIGTSILKECLRESGGNMEKALAIYNVGYGSICRHVFLRTGRQYGRAVLRDSRSISSILRVDNR